MASRIAGTCASLLALLGALALLVLLILASAEAMNRRAAGLDLTGFAYPQELRTHIEDKQRESRHWWFRVVLPAHAAEVVALWLLLLRVRPPGNRLGWVIFIVATQLAAYLKLATGGWLILALAMAFYPILFVAHGAANILVLRSAGSHSMWVLTANVVFLFAILLQYDFGDGYGWLTITAMLGDGAGGSLSRAPGWIDFGILYNLGLFIPTVLAWLAAVTNRSARVSHAHAAHSPTFTTS